MINLFTQTMKKLFFIPFLFLGHTSFAQQDRSTSMGQITSEELQMTSYAKDSTAKALVLFEHANYYRDSKSDYRFATDHYKRIKIFNKDAAKEEIIVKIYTGKEGLVKDIKAVTYYLEDGLQKSITLEQDQIFTSQVSERFKETSFTLPGVIDGAVIEYSYKKTTPYLGISDWYFQSDIPKVRSQFDLAILGNYQYNMMLLSGFLDLDKNESSVKDYCMELPDGRVSACAIYSYAMNDIPAFKEEDFMLSKKNYLSRISLNLKSITTKTNVVAGMGTRVDTKVKNITKTWEDADKALRLDFLNHQTTKKTSLKKGCQNTYCLR